VKQIILPVQKSDLCFFLPQIANLGKYATFQSEIITIIEL
jgi:hypothetical protein